MNSPQWFGKRTLSAVLEHYKNMDIGTSSQLINDAGLLLHMGIYEQPENTTLAELKPYFDLLEGILFMADCEEARQEAIKAKLIAKQKKPVLSPIAREAIDEMKRIGKRSKY